MFTGIVVEVARARRFFATAPTGSTYRSSTPCAMASDLVETLCVAKRFDGRGAGRGHEVGGGSQNHIACHGQVEMLRKDRDIAVPAAVVDHVQHVPHLVAHVESEREAQLVEDAGLPRLQQESRLDKKSATLRQRLRVVHFGSYTLLVMHEGSGVADCHQAGAEHSTGGQACQHASAHGAGHRRAPPRRGRVFAEVARLDERFNPSGQFANPLQR